MIKQISWIYSANNNKNKKVIEDSSILTCPLLYYHVKKLVTNKLIHFLALYEKRKLKDKQI